MIQVCIMSGHDGQLGSESKVYLTLMGGCELIRPTFARQILANRQQERAGRSKRPRQTFVTLLGGTEIKAPTLAEEFIELQELLSSGQFSMEDWDRNAAEAGRSDVSVASFTLMAGFDECELPSENEEIDRLALHRHLGTISEAASQTLQYGIGQRGAERRATLRRALLAVT